MVRIFPHLVLTQVSALTVLALTIHWADKYMGGFGTDKTLLFNYHPGMAARSRPAPSSASPH